MSHIWRDRYNIINMMWVYKSNRKTYYKIHKINRFRQILCLDRTWVSQYHILTQTHKISLLRTMNNKMGICICRNLRWWWCLNSNRIFMVHSLSTWLETMFSQISSDNRLSISFISLFNIMELFNNQISHITLVSFRQFNNSKLSPIILDRTRWWWFQTCRRVSMDNRLARSKQCLILAMQTLNYLLRICQDR